MKGGIRVADILPVLSSTLRVVWLLLFAVSLLWPQVVPVTSARYDGLSREQTIRSGEYGRDNLLADFSLRGNKECDKHQTQERDERCAILGYAVKFLLNPIDSVVGRVGDFQLEPVLAVVVARNVIRGPPCRTVLRSL